LHGREVRPPSTLVDVMILDGVTASIVLNHPRHKSAQKSLAELIAQLRASANVEDGYAVQQALLDQVLAAEKARNAFS
jgi:hypothetical protein